ncbi:alanine racemase [Paracoccus sp. p4-l81]|uniref:alanine racemase n=1 Tax=Paracoccus sp. p4-l81 TaxID=3342806 RepID=UPI0035B9E8D8
MDFQAVTRALAQAGIVRPALVLDRRRLRDNLSVLAAGLPADHAVRLADKSIPAPDLIAAGMAGLSTDRIMSFHLPLTARVLARFPQAEVLMGKPMPAAAAAAFRRDVAGADRVIWLIDRCEVLRDYLSLAAADGRPMRLVFEVDIGLGRGGYARPSDLAAAAGRVTAPVQIEGLMGYEAHVSALPRLLGGQGRAGVQAMARLSDFIAALPPGARRILNTGGSSTALAMPAGTPGNEVVVGSALVKPSDFDQPCNAALTPALFIVTPVLKTVPHGLPGHPRLSEALRGARLIGDRIAFGWGGKWMAQPVYPAGLRPSPFYAPSSNQQGWVLPRGAPEPTVIALRPTQSEAVIQDFAEILIHEDGRITDSWPVWPPG